MMYSVYADETCIYSDSFIVENTKAINPKLTLEDNAAGSLSITLPLTNAGYSTVTRLVSNIVVYKNGNEIWAGRVLSEKTDFYNNRTLYCEGEIAFFNDSVQPPAEYTGRTIRQYLEALIEVHNSKVNADRRFTLGAVTVNDPDTPTYYTNYENTMSLINALIETYGGHMRVRKENGVRYLDYLASYPNVCDQTIRFGKNLLDFTRTFDMTEFATVIVPLGARLEDSEIEALDAYLTVAEVNDGKIYVKSENAVVNYGWIEKTINWDNVEDPATLLEYAQAYLSDSQFDSVVLELSALDLHYLNLNVEGVKLLDEIRVISPPHGLNHLFPVTKLEIPLDSPEQTQFTLGTVVRTSLTDVHNQVNNQILSKIENLPKAHSVLKEAKENAAAIMNLATNGYITITKDQNGSEALYISNERNYAQASKYWRWNVNGLAYYDSSSGSVNLPIAITMDGSIVADFITTGTMSADRVRAGKLESTNKNVVFNLDAGTLTMKSGSIQLGNYSGGHYQFEVDNNGRLYAGSSAIFAGQLSAATGSFGGDISAATGTFKGTVQASDFLDASGNSMLSNGKWSRRYLDLGNIQLDGTTGNITLTGAIKFGANTSMDDGNGTYNNLNTLFSDVNSRATTANNTANSANSLAATANNRANSAYSLADSADSKADNAAADVLLLATGGYNPGQNTFINGKCIYSPTIFSNEFIVYPENNSINSGGFAIRGRYYPQGNTYEMLRIAYNFDTAPTIGFYVNYRNIDHTIWAMPNTHVTSDVEFSGGDVTFNYCDVNFNQCTISGIHAVFA